jgi:PKD repeat protein
MLDVAEMKNIGTTYAQTSACSNSNPRACRRFQEDCQTFYVSGTTTGWGGRNCNRGEYTMDNGYRFCCTSYTWSGAMLMTLMMKDANGVSAKQLWNWPAFFDYVDFWVGEQGLENKGTFINDFSRQMWKAYRNNIVPVQVGGVNFSADRTTGRPPLTVTFTNQSDAKDTTFKWDFGDGATSTEKNPVHVYNDLGTYTVTLTGNSSETKTRTDYIVVKGGTILIEAENMTLDGYVAEPGFGGRDVIKIDPAKTTGTATTTFTGASGIYKIDFYAVPERDGNPVVKLYINNTLVMNETYPSNAGMMSTAEQVYYLTDVTINTGDVIKIEGTMDAEAWARVDKMLLTQVGGNQTIANDRMQKAISNCQGPGHANPLTIREFKNWVVELEKQHILYYVYNARGELVRSLQTVEPGIYFFRIGNNTSRAVITK